MAANNGDSANPLSALVKQYTVLLTSHRPNGTGVDTPVNIAVDGDHAYFRTWGESFKVRRMRDNPDVEIAPSTLGGKATGAAFPARVRELDQGSEECQRAARLLTRKHPLLHGVIVPLTHRLKRYTTVHYELRPVTAETAGRPETTEAAETAGGPESAEAEAAPEGSRQAKAENGKKAAPEGGEESGEAAG